MAGISNHLRRFDAYSKTSEDFRIRTVSGATISIIALVVCGILFLSELWLYLRTDIQPSLYVDTIINDQMLINFDIEFPHLSCNYLTLDVMDVAGEHQIDIEQDVYKTRLSRFGTPVSQPAKDVARAKIPKRGPEYCGSCYGSKDEGLCCNTCEEVREAYRLKGWAFDAPDSMEQCLQEGFVDKIQQEKNEGCRMHGKIHVNKVAGNFHIAPGKSFQRDNSHVHDLQPFKGIPFNTTHTVRSLTFGEKFPRSKIPLKKRVSVDNKMMTMHQYFLQIVPTTYRSRSGFKVSSYQYSVTDYKHQVDAHYGRGGLPGVFFRYEFSPIRIDYTEEREPFTHFLTSISAIIGGIFTIAGLLDTFVYHSMNSLRGKMDLGKQT